MQNISISINDAVLGRLDKIAETEQRSRASVLDDALRQYFARYDWEIEAIKEGIRDADAGNVVPHEQVMADIEAIIEARRK